MNLALRKPITLAEFLAWEERQPLRYEFDGVGPVAMTGERAPTRAFRRISRSRSERAFGESPASSTEATSRSALPKITFAIPMGL